MIVRTIGLARRMPSLVLAATLVTTATAVAATRCRSCSIALNQAAATVPLQTDAPLLIAALDTVRLMRAPLWKGSTRTRVSQELAWWPVRGAGTRTYAPAAPIPLDLAESASRAGDSISIVRWNDVVQSSGAITSGPPVVEFSPVDYAGKDIAVVHVLVYTGPNGQELYRVWLRFDDKQWKPFEVGLEYQS